MSVVPFRPSGSARQSRRQKSGKTSATGVGDAPYKRKLVAFDAATWHALHLLAGDTMKDFQEIAEEAFADLLKKYHRPTELKQALRQSVREDSRGQSAKQRPKPKPSTHKAANAPRRRAPARRR
jgi:hypothetical protein